MSTLQVIGEKQEVVTEAIAGDYMGITCTATLCLVRDIPVLSETLSVWASSPIPVIFSFLYSFLLCVLTALNLFTFFFFWKIFSRPPPFVSKHICPASYMEPMLCFRRMLWKKYCWSGKLFQRLLMARYPGNMFVLGCPWKVWGVYVLDTLLSKFVYKLVGPQFFCFSTSQFVIVVFDV